MIPHNSVNVFGFHTRNTVPGDFGPWDNEDGIHRFRLGNQNGDYEGGSAKAAAIAENVMKIAGYIPGIGLIPGIMRVCIPDRDAYRNIRTIERIRGIVEILCLGIVYLIPDLIVTIRRFNSNAYIGRIPYAYPGKLPYAYGMKGTYDATIYNVHVGHSFETIKTALPTSARSLEPNEGWNIGKAAVYF